MINSVTDLLLKVPDCVDAGLSDSSFAILTGDDQSRLSHF
jgi:hypothetical protein